MQRRKRYGLVSNPAHVHPAAIGNRVDVGPHFGSSLAAGGAAHIHPAFTTHNAPALHSVDTGEGGPVSALGYSDASFAEIQTVYNAATKHPTGWMFVRSLFRTRTGKSKTENEMPVVQELLEAMGEYEPGGFDELFAEIARFNELNEKPKDGLVSNLQTREERIVADIYNKNSAWGFLVKGTEATAKMFTRVGLSFFLPREMIDGIISANPRSDALKGLTKYVSTENRDPGPVMLDYKDSWHSTLPAFAEVEQRFDSYMRGEAAHPMAMDDFHRVLALLRSREIRKALPDVTDPLIVVWQLSHEGRFEKALSDIVEAAGVNFKIHREAQPIMTVKQAYQIFQQSFLETHEHRMILRKAAWAGNIYPVLFLTDVIDELGRLGTVVPEVPKNFRFDSDSLKQLAGILDLTGGLEVPVGMNFDEFLVTLPISDFDSLPTKLAKLAHRFYSAYHNFVGKMKDVDFRSFQQQKRGAVETFMHAMTEFIDEFIFPVGKVMGHDERYIRTVAVAISAKMGPKIVGSIIAQISGFVIGQGAAQALGDYASSALIPVFNTALYADIVNSYHAEMKDSTVQSLKQNMYKYSLYAVTGKGGGQFPAPSVGYVHCRQITEKSGLPYIESMAIADATRAAGDLLLGPSPTSHLLEQKVKGVAQTVCETVNVPLEPPNAWMKTYLSALNFQVDAFRALYQHTGDLSLSIKACPNPAIIRGVCEDYVANKMGILANRFITAHIQQGLSNVCYPLLALSNYFYYDDKAFTTATINLINMLVSIRSQVLSPKLRAQYARGVELVSGPHDNPFALVQPINPDQPKALDATFEKLEANPNGYSMRNPMNEENIQRWKTGKTKVLPKPMPDPVPMNTADFLDETVEGFRSRVFESMYFAASVWDYFMGCVSDLVQIATVVGLNLVSTFRGEMNMDTLSTLVSQAFENARIPARVFFVCLSTAIPFVLKKKVWLTVRAVWWMLMTMIQLPFAALTPREPIKPRSELAKLIMQIRTGTDSIASVPGQPAAADTPLDEAAADQLALFLNREIDINSIQKPKGDAKLRERVSCVMCQSHVLDADIVTVSRSLVFGNKRDESAFADDFIDLSKRDVITGILEPPPGFRCKGVIIHDVLFPGVKLAEVLLGALGLVEPGCGTVALSLEQFEYSDLFFFEMAVAMREIHDFMLTPFCHFKRIIFCLDPTYTTYHVRNGALLLIDWMFPYDDEHTTLVDMKGIEIAKKASKTLGKILTEYPGQMKFREVVIIAQKQKQQPIFRYDQRLASLIRVYKGKASSITGAIEVPVGFESLSKFLHRAYVIGCGAIAIDVDPADRNGVKLRKALDRALVDATLNTSIFLCYQKDMGFLTSLPFPNAHKTHQSFTPISLQQEWEYAQVYPKEFPVNYEKRKTWKRFPYIPRISDIVCIDAHIHTDTRVEIHPDKLNYWERESSTRFKIYTDQTKLDFALKFSEAVKRCLDLTNATGMSSIAFYLYAPEAGSGYKLVSSELYTLFFFVLREYLGNSSDTSRLHTIAFSSHDSGEFAFARWFFHPNPHHLDYPILHHIGLELGPIFPPSDTWD